MTSKQRIQRIRRWIATCDESGCLAALVHSPPGNPYSEYADSERWINRIQRADTLMAKELDWLCSLASEVCHLSSEAALDSGRQPRTNDPWKYPKGYNR